MKVAIPYWQGRISPVFDVAARLLLVEYEGQTELDRLELALEDQDPRLRAAELARAGADVLICGAISRPQELAIAAVGIELIALTCGPIDEVLAAWRDGTLRQGRFLMPGCCRRRRRFRGQDHRWPETTEY